MEAGSTNTSDQFLEIAERSTIFNGVVASTISDVLWTRQGEPQRLRGNFGTPNTFEVMGVPPLLGHVITPAGVAAIPTEHYLTATTCTCSSCCWFTWTVVRAGGFLGKYFWKTAFITSIWPMSLR